MNPILNHEQLCGALALAKQATLLARSLTTEMDAEVAAVKAKFEGKILAKTAEVEAVAAAVHGYADKNRTFFFSERKTTTLNGHAFGWRDNGGSIKTVRGVTEKKLLERLLRSRVLRKLFVREKPALDKEAMKSKWATFKGQLSALGARFKHEETFFLELDVTPEVKAKT